MISKSKTFFSRIKITLPSIKKIENVESGSGKEKVECDEENAIGKAKKSVVKIVGDYIIGSGFIISSDGYVVTNYHVIQNEVNPHVVFDNGKSYLAKIISYDPIVDLAILKIAEKDLPVLSWGNSDEFSIGSAVYALGYPWADILKGEISVTKGIFSAKRRSDDGVVEFIQTDTSLNHGNSGGPLIDRCGKVVGVNIAVIKETEGLNFAISQKIAQPLAKTLIENPDTQKQSHSLDYEDSQNLTNLPPVDTVYLFYNYISLRRIEEAYNLLSSNYHKVTTLEEAIRGYENTLNIYVNDIYVTNADKPAVYVNLTSVDLAGDKTVFKNWEGEWFLIMENGEWKLDDGTIHEIK